MASIRSGVGPWVSRSSRLSSSSSVASPSGGSGASASSAAADATPTPEPPDELALADTSPIVIEGDTGVLATPGETIVVDHLVRNTAATARSVGLRVATEADIDVDVSSRSVRVKRDEIAHVETSLTVPDDARVGDVLTYEVVAVNVDDIRESPAAEIISLLRARGADVSYHDPHIAAFPSMRRYDIGLESVDLTAPLLGSCDCAVAVTDHDSIDWALVGAHAPLVIDTRDVMKRNAGAVRARVVKA